jgi:hypothetical protein
LAAFAAKVPPPMKDYDDHFSVSPRFDRSQFSFFAEREQGGVRERESVLGRKGENGREGERGKEKGIVCNNERKIGWKRDRERNGKKGTVKFREERRERGSEKWRKKGREKGREDMREKERLQGRESQKERKGKIEEGE